MIHPADESRKQIFFHGYLPAMIAVLFLIVSIGIDLCSPGLHLTQRAGTMIIVLGAYVAYIDVKSNVKIINNALYINLELPYQIISIALVVIGTLITGYADLVL